MKKTIRLTRIALAAALIAVCAWIHVPFVIPFTLQTFALFVISGLLPTWDCVAAVGIYLLLGVVGLPVFSGFRGGAGVLLSATGGYLVGFLPQAFLQSLMIRRLGRKFLPLLGAMVAGLAVCYLFGTIWYCVGYVSGTGFFAALMTCVVPYLPVDAVKILVAIVVVQRVYPALQKLHA